LLCAVPIALFLMLFDERVASRAGAQLDRMLVEKFSSWGDYRLFHLPQQWLRMGPDVIRVGRVDDDGTLLDVSVLHLGPGFTLEQRTDAETMRHLSDERWTLNKSQVRDFTGAASHLVTSPELTLRFP